MEKIMSKTTTDGHVMKSEVLDKRELSLEELEAVSGGSVSIFGVTLGDVADGVKDGAKWVWNKLF